MPAPESFLTWILRALGLRYSLLLPLAALVALLLTLVVLLRGKGPMAAGALILIVPMSLAALGASPRAGQVAVPPEIRAKLFMALLGLVVLGLALVVVVLLMGRWARGWSLHDRRPSRAVRSGNCGRVSASKVRSPNDSGLADPDAPPHETRRIGETGPMGE